jgi:hypothetical protein
VLGWFESTERSEFFMMQQDFKATVVDAKLSVTAISSLKNLSKIEKEVDAFIASHTTNPFMLIPFLKVNMRSMLSSELTPIVLVVRADEKIVGVATFVLKRAYGIWRSLLKEQLGTYSADSLFGYYFSPDFILDDAYRQESVRCVLNFLFDTMDCRFVTVYLPVGSPNLHLLPRQCEDDGTSLRMTSSAFMAYRFMPVNCNWDSFQSGKGRHFNRKFKKMERNFGFAGSSKVLFFENETAMKGVFQRILEVERASWKQRDRFQHGFTLDSSLVDIWEASSMAYKAYDGFKLLVWLLELNGDSIAYSLGCQYKGTAYLAKTSFDDKWKTLYPGIYINGLAIRDLFRSGEVKAISFMTNLPFHERWTSVYLPRVKVLMWRGALPRLLEFFVQFRGFQFFMRFARSRYLSSLPRRGIIRFIFSLLESV